MHKLITITLIAAATLTLTACGSIISTKCVQFQPNLVNAKYDKIKQIAIEEANQNGFKGITTEIKPTKYNDYIGSLIFKVDTMHGTDSLYIEFDHDKTCFKGGGMVATPETAIKAMLDRYQHL